jgi:arginase
VSAAFVVVPQWQGSGSSRAMRLVDGAEAIRGDLPAASTFSVNVPLEAGDELNTGIARAGSLRLVHERTLAVLAEIDGWAITVGGDCGVSLAAVGHANERRAGDLAVVWLDAHPDLNTPQSSPSGAFGGMVLRALTGEGVEGLLPARPVDPSRIVLAGVRATDDGEEQFMTAAGIRSIGVEQLDTPDDLVAAITATGASSVYLHIDVDVLDPAEIAGLNNPLPFGITGTQLTGLVRAVKAAFPLAGATIAGFTPSSPEAAVDDLGTLLRVIGALTA